MDTLISNWLPRKVKILDNIYQEIAEDEITIYGNNGANCGENLIRFALTDTLILSLYLRPDSTYFLQGSCGLNFLRYSNDQVYASVTWVNTFILPDITSMGYSNFINNIDRCIPFLSNSQEVIPPNSVLEIFPNPMHDYLNINAPELSIKEIRVFDINGKLLFTKKIAIREEELRIDLSHLNRGVYILKIHTDDFEWSKKLVKS